MNIYVDRFSVKRASWNKIFDISHQLLIGRGFTIYLYSHQINTFLLYRGPFYLIMEFAQHGSLRSYLRKKKCQQQRECGSSQISNKEFHKEVLNFSLQISQGMTYLEGLKVNRKYSMTMFEKYFMHQSIRLKNIL